MQSAFKNISAAVKGFLPSTAKRSEAVKAERKQTIQISATATTTSDTTNSIMAGNKVGGSTMSDETSTNANLLGEEFRAAREELGYKFEDLTEHTGLSADEIEALELGDYQKIEQQDYIEYYVHNYATLLGLDSDLALEHYQQYIVPETAALQTGEAASKFDIHDEDQYEDAFADEAKKTIEALEVSELTTLENYGHVEPEIDFSANRTADYPTDTTPEMGDSGSAYVVGSINVSNLNDKQKAAAARANQATTTANPLNSLDGDNQYLGHSATAGQKPFPWLRIVAAAIFAAALAGSIYFMVTLQQSADPTNLASVDVATDDGQQTPPVITPVVKIIGTLETTIIAKGNDDLTAPTATMVQKPLIMRSQTAVAKNPSAAEASQATTTDETAALSGASSAVKQNGATSSSVEQSVATSSTEQVATTSIAKTAATTTEGIVAVNASDAQSPLDALPNDESQFSLHATQNNWLLIEDDTSQILFSGELTPEKIFTLPKIKGVIISLGNAGIIDVYQGKTLLGKLGKDDESLDLASIETRLNLIAETANNSN